MDRVRERFDLFRDEADAVIKYLRSSVR
jgi:hypothetical protein